MSDRVGTAEWFPPEAFSETYPYTKGTFWLGRSPIDGEPVGHVDDRHICLVSGSRSGKGTTTIINNLCLWPGSVVVVDPKGENATVTAARRGPGSKYCEGMGQAVHVLDPFRVAQVDESLRSRFNPLDALDPSDPFVIDEAGRLADAIVVVNKDASEPFWDESARTLVKGLILHVLSSPQFEGRRNLLTVRELISRGDHEGIATLKAMGVDELPSAQAILWEGVSKNPAFGGIVAGIGETVVNMAVNSARLFESVLQVANRNTEFLDSPGMRSCLVESDFKLADLKTDPKGVSVYLSLPQRYMSEHYRWLRMMISLIVTEMEAVKGQPASGHRVLVCLDEFAGLKRMEVIENAVAQIAGFGVTLFFVLQSLEQLEKVYGKGWETFLGCSATKLFFAIDDKFTREYVSRLIGETELIREVRSRGQTDGTNESDTLGRNRSTTDGENVSVSEGRTRSTSESRSQSSTAGESQSTTEGTSRSLTRGTNRSVTEGRSFTEGWSESVSTSKNWGKNVSEGQSEGTSHNESWSPPPFFFRNTMRYLPFLRENETANYGTSQSASITAGRSSGRSRGTTRGTSGSSGESASKTEGASESSTLGSSSSTTLGESRSETLGRSESVSEGQSESRSFGQSRSETTGESTSRTTGRSSSRNEGQAETIQKRPLITPDEIGVMFDRPSNGRIGWALVLIGGARPAVVQRTPYFADPFFAWLFDPHPDHAPPPELMGELPLLLPDLGDGAARFFTRLFWLKEEGDAVEWGEPIAEGLVCGPKTLYPDHDDLYALIKHAPDQSAPRFAFDGEVPLNSTEEVRLPICSPANGRLIRRMFKDGDNAKDLGTERPEYGALHVNRRQHLLESAHPLEEPLERYAAFLSDLDRATSAASEAMARRTAEDKAERKARERAEAEARRKAAEEAERAREAEAAKRERLTEAERRFMRSPEWMTDPEKFSGPIVLLCIAGGVVYALSAGRAWWMGALLGVLSAFVPCGLAWAALSIWARTMERSRRRKWGGMSEAERERYAGTLDL